MITRTEAKLAARMLRIELDETKEYGNGNEFDLVADTGLTKDEAGEILEASVGHQNCAEYIVKRLEEESQRPEATAMGKTEGLIPLGFYQHFKGGKYFVLGFSRHSESGEELVLYRGEDGRFWARPVGIFTDTVTAPNGERRPRFRLIA